MSHNFRKFAEEALEEYIIQQVEVAFNSADTYPVPYELQNEIDSRIAELMYEKINEELENLVENKLDSFINAELEE